MCSLPCQVDIKYFYLDERLEVGQVEITFVFPEVQPVWIYREDLMEEPLSCSGSAAHMLTLIVLVLTASLHGQWFWLEWGWVSVLGQGSLFGSLSPFPPPILPFIPLPIHLSCSDHLGSCHLIQLITDWDGLWETSLVHGFAPLTWIIYSM